MCVRSRRQMRCGRADRGQLPDPVFPDRLYNPAIIGAHAIAPGARDLIHEFAIAMQTHAFAGRLPQTVHAYPTWPWASSRWWYASSPRAGPPLEMHARSGSSWIRDPANRPAVDLTRFVC